MHLAVVNESKRVTSAQIAEMCEAMELGFASYCKDYELEPCTCAPVASEAAVPAGAVPFFVVDEPDVAGAGGYHDRDSKGRAFARVFVNPYLDNGGVVIATTAAAFDSSVLGAFTHEGFEARGDLECNEYATINAKKETALEDCDACEDIGWPVTLKSGKTVYISDYLLRAWFTTGAAGPYDKCARLSGPFKLSPLGGGYMIMQKLSGAETQQTSDELDDADDDPCDTDDPCHVHEFGTHTIVTGPRFPAWKLELKTKHGRAGRRSHRSRPVEDELTAEMA